MRVSIVMASINELENVKAFEPMLVQDDCNLIVVDEGDEKVRRRNDVILARIPHEYYGVREREEWFKQRFGSDFFKYLSVIPERCHAETSFGFLVAYEQITDLIVELDDDVFPWREQSIIGCHADNLFKEDGVTVSCEGKWYNTMENLKLNIDEPIFARGHPYAEESRSSSYVWREVGGRCVLNMGLWAGFPDLDALTILYHGGLNGRCRVTSGGHKRSKVIPSEGTYFPICSMNSAFVPEVVPAFYQLHMNYMGVDRFDDIWSGVFLKKVADHLGERVCLGAPLVNHDKRPRDTFGDLEKELRGMTINETLWKLVDEAQIEGKTYFEAYSSLINELETRIPRTFEMHDHRKFLKFQTERMKLWLDIVDKLK